MYESISRLKEYLGSSHLFMFITSTDYERDALDQMLTPLDGYERRQIHIIDNIAYYAAKLGMYNIVHFKCSSYDSQDIEESVNVLFRSIDFWNPDSILIIGAAYGNNSNIQNIGDVIVSRLVIDYDSNSLYEDKTSSSSNIFESGHMLYEIFSSLTELSNDSKSNTKNKILHGAILSGEKPENIDSASNLFKKFSQSLGIEFEAFGICSALYRKSVKWIMIKGICGFINAHDFEKHEENFKNAVDSAINLCKEVFNDNRLNTIPKNSKRTNIDKENISDFEDVENNELLRTTRFLTKTPSNVDSEFIHRETLVDELCSSINESNKSMLVSDIRGVGKTTIARALFHQLKDKFDFVAWIEYDGSLKQSILNSFNLFKDINDSVIRYQKIKSYLQESKNVLLIIDDVTKSEIEDEELKWLQSLDIAVILTSNINNIGHFEPKTIDILSIDECIDIFYKYYKNDQNRKFSKTVKKLVELVSRHTLTIELLAKVANRNDTDLDGFYSMLKSIEFGFPYIKTDESQTSNTLIIAENIKKILDVIDLSDLQIIILKNFAIMPDIEIPLEIDKWLNVEVYDILVLCKYGLITFSETGYFMSPIIKSAVFKKYDIVFDDHKQLIKTIATKDVINRTDTFTKAYALLDIADALFSRFTDEKNIEFGIFCNNIAVVYQDQGEYLKALEFFKKALEISKENLGREHTNTATTYNNIASVYHQIGDFSSALDYYNYALAIHEKILGDEHPYTAATYNNIAVVYQNLGDYVNALDFFNKALNIREKTLGFSHPETATTYNNIGVVYKNQGNYAKSLDCFNKALSIWINNYGNDHPYTATLYNNIAVVYLNQSEYDKANEFYDKALNVRKSTLGEDHPLTKKTQEDLITVNNAKINKSIYSDYPLNDNSFKNSSESTLIDLIDRDTEKYKNAMRSKYESEIFDNKTKAIFEYLKNSDDINDLDTFKYFLSDFINSIKFVKKKLIFNPDNEIDICHYSKIMTLNHLIKNDNKSFPKFRLSNVAYLNDPSEGKILIEIFRKYINNDILNELYGMNTEDNKLSEIFMSNVFIGCFTTAKNKLPMWTLYGDYSQGCCLILEDNFFNNVNIAETKKASEYSSIIEQDLTLYRVKYLNINEINKDDVIMKQIQLIANLLAKWSGIIGKHRIVKEWVLNLLEEIRFLFKDSDYEYEDEIRLIVHANDFDIRLDDSNKLAAPKLYIELHKELLYKEVILGSKIEKPYEIAPFLLHSGVVKKVTKSGINYQ